jgi:hypothetical protein
MPAETGPVRRSRGQGQGSINFRRSLTGPGHNRTMIDLSENAVSRSPVGPRYVASELCWQWMSLRGVLSLRAVDLSPPASPKRRIQAIIDDGASVVTRQPTGSRNAWARGGRRGVRHGVLVDLMAKLFFFDLSVKAVFPKAAPKRGGLFLGGWQKVRNGAGEVFCDLHASSG